jgi:hypothetical protein
MRRQRWSFGQAVRQGGVAEATVLKYMSPAFTTDTRGRIVARPHDRLLRIMPFWTPRRQIPLATHDSRQASEIGRYNWAVRHMLEGKGGGPLKRFEGRSLRIGRESYPFVTDRLLLQRLHLRDTPEYEGYSRVL